ncbi:hypothetical protein K503DRAFT_508483 [Rhizopogon vinicolor AM-OR11-026]|uniref:Uncharacterized protein n=1 Tax=Rhizopogon vinicolor AM-OR11-026 TaxID=1314800 RepID=A0A1B7MM41_9AGAM|nr:hypothetical protein K503DRAFT_508483 [Rhizopogon vinicolor AM-OR11-026]
MREACSCSMRFAVSFYECFRVTNVTFLAHIQWIEETLIKAIQLASPSLTVSICIFISYSAAASQPDLSGEDNSAFSRPVEKNYIPEPSVMTREIHYHRRWASR